MLNSDRKLCLLLGICALSAGVLSQLGCSAAGQPDATGEPFQVGHTEVWFPETFPLYAAQKAWGLPAPAIPVYELADGETVATACGFAKDVIVTGCTLPWQNKVLIRSGMRDEIVDSTKLHEIGHYLTGKGEHIDSPDCKDINSESAYVMCAYGAFLTFPTTADFDWAL